MCQDLYRQALAYHMSGLGAAGQLPPPRIPNFISHNARRTEQSAGMADAEAPVKPPPLPTQAPDDPDYQKRSTTLAGFVVLLALVFTATLTTAGFGAATYRGLSGAGALAGPCKGLAGLAIAVLYFADARMWTEASQIKTRNIVAGVAVFLYLLSTLLGTHGVPYAPVEVFLYSSVGVFVGVKAVMFKDDHPGNFISSLGWPLIGVGVLYLLVTVGVMVATDNWWFGDAMATPIRNDSRVRYTNMLMGPDFGTIGVSVCTLDDPYCACPVVHPKFHVDPKTLEIADNHEYCELPAATPLDAGEPTEPSGGGPAEAAGRRRAQAPVRPPPPPSPTRPPRPTPTPTTPPAPPARPPKAPGTPATPAAPGDSTPAPSPGTAAVQPAAADAHDPKECPVHVVPRNWRCLMPVATDGSGVQPVDYCAAAWILWANPLLLAISFIMVGWTALIVSSYSKNLRKKLPDTDLTMFIVVLLLFFMVSWVALAVGGAIMGLKAVSSTVTVTILIFGGIMAGCCVGWDVVWANFMANSTYLRIVSYVQSIIFNDWFRAIVLDFGFVVLAVCFAGSWVNQQVRKSFGTKVMDADEAAQPLTPPMMAVLEDMKKWPWTSVLSKMIMLGVFYFFMSVIIAKITVVFFAWMNQAVAEWPLAFVSLLYIVTGLTNFLNPACPATPVYLTGGIIVGRAAETYFSHFFCNQEKVIDNHVCHTIDNAEGCFGAAGCQWGGECVHICPSGFWVGSIYTTLSVFALKLLAIVGEQKGIGEHLGKMLVVRKTIGVNSTGIRAFQKVLEQPGLNWRKVMILVGGPDWPISVLTGILRLNVWQMLLGSTPFYVMVAPVVLSGSFVLKLQASEGTPDAALWESGTLVIGSIAGLITGGMFVGCLAVVEWATQHYADEIAAMPIDEEVREAEEESARKKAVYMRATAWKHVPSLQRLFLIGGACMMTASCVLFSFQGSKCFEAVKVSMDVYASPLCGSLIKLVKPLGWVGIALQGGGLLCIFAFNNWAGARLKNFVDDGGPASPSTAAVDNQVALAGTGAPAGTGKAVGGDYAPPVLDHIFAVANPAAASKPVEPTRGPPGIGGSPHAVAAVEETEV